MLVSAEEVLAGTAQGGDLPKSADGMCFGQDQTNRGRNERVQVLYAAVGRPQDSANAPLAGGSTDDLPGIIDAERPTVLASAQIDDLT
jgi:hypothetical protein